MVRNLCASQKYHTMHYFLTFTCNQKLHFGTSPIKNWIDGDEWKHCFKDFFDRPQWEQQEIHNQLIQAAGPLLLRNWLEARTFLVEYLRGSESSPYFPAECIFVRDEYQDHKGNLPHIHMMISIKLEELNSEQKERLDDLIRASPGELVKPHEVQGYINEGIFQNIHEIEEKKELCKKLNSHRCTPRCLMRVDHKNGKFDYRCRKTNNFRISPDNTRHCNVPLPVERSQEALDILIDIGLAEPRTINEFGHEETVKCNHSYFHPVKNIPPTLSTFDPNMSPVEGKTFSVCQSQQNIQTLRGNNGCNKYVLKYAAKQDAENMVIFRTHPHDVGRIISQAQFIHNSKISTSKYNEEKALDKSRQAHLHKGRALSYLQMYQMLLGYPEVKTDLIFVSVPTLPYEQRAGIEKSPVTSNIANSQNNAQNYKNDDYDNIDDNADLTIPAHEIRTELDLPDHRMHSESALLTLDSIFRSHVSVDRISKFSIRPPEFIGLFDNPGDYFRWFRIKSNTYTRETISMFLAGDASQANWFDGVLHSVFVRDKALKEVAEHLRSLYIDQNDPKFPLCRLFLEMNRLFDIHVEFGLEDDDLETWQAYRKFIYQEREKHLPVPVYNYIKPTMGTRFILHILLSMGNFETEYDLILHPSLKESLRYAKLIGPLDDEASLKKYSRQLLRRYILQQLVYFPNSTRVTDSWIVTAKVIFDTVILSDEIPISDMPPMLQTDLDEEKEDIIQSILSSFKKNMLDSAYDEMQNSLELHQIPPKETLLAINDRSQALNWNALETFSKSNNQSDDSFIEQRQALANLIDSINDYCDPCRQHLFTKARTIIGFPGSGKSYLLSYIVIYSISKGFKVGMTAMMSKRANVLGGIHIHKLFKLPCKGKQNLHRLAELAIVAMKKKPEWIQVLSTLNILFIDEIGQLSAEMLCTLDIILRKIRQNNIFFGGLLIIATMDHKQLPPVKGTPFLVSPHIITCFKFSILSHSVRASQDPHLERAVNIARMNPLSYTHEILEEFQHLIANAFTHVSDWNNEIITPDVFRIFSKKLPAKESVQEYIKQVMNQLPDSDYIERESCDFQNRVSSLSEWVIARENTRLKLDKVLKEPRYLLFFVGALYEFTFNEENVFSQSQLGLLIKLPDPEDVREFRKIEIMVAPPGLKTFIFNNITDEEYYTSRGWKKQTIGVAREYDIPTSGSLKGRRKQYGIKHHVTSTVHSCQGDTLHKVATEVSHINRHYKLWDKGQVVVLLSRTRLAKDLIFVGSKTETVTCLVNLIQTKSQWSDYMERVISIVKVNPTNDELPSIHQRIFSYEVSPFEFTHLPLPQCSTGYVYFLVSMRNRRLTYIGQTYNLKSRLAQHNSGSGTYFTNEIQNRPWAILAYIAGFDRNKTSMLSMEDSWKRLRNNAIHNGTRDPRELVRTAYTIVENNIDLRLIIHFKE